MSQIKPEKQFYICSHISTIEGLNKYCTTPTQPQPQPHLNPHPYPNPTLTLAFWLGVSYYALSPVSSRLSRLPQVSHLLQSKPNDVNVDLS